MAILKRQLALLLVLVMTLTMLSMPAYADSMSESETPPTVLEDTATAEESSHNVQTPGSDDDNDDLVDLGSPENPDHNEQTPGSDDDCDHAVTEIAWDTNYNVTYMKINDTQHKVTGYQYTYCTACFERIGESFATEEVVNHELDSNGDCRLCGYSSNSGCTHAITETAWDTDYNVTYTKINDTQHKVTGYQYTYCTACFEHVGESFAAEEVENHSYNASGVCTLCGYDDKPECLHRNLIPDLPYIYKEFYYRHDGKNHQHAFLGGAICVDCGISLPYDTVTYTYEPHVMKMGADGFCIFCGENVGLFCLHDKFESAVMWNGRATYTSLNKEQHQVEGIQYRYCTNCGKRISNNFPAVEQENHTFDAAGDCTLCDYRTVCTHPTSEIMWSNDPMTYTSLNKEQHQVEGTQYHYCTVCCKRISENFPAVEQENHTFDDFGDCTLCDYRVGCPHSETTKKLYDTLCESIDEDFHEVTTLYSKVCANEECGKVLVEVEPSYTEIKQEKHDFDKNSCTLCGYESGAGTGCAHENTETVTSTELTITSETHHKVTTTIFEECSICHEKTEKEKTEDWVEHTPMNTDSYGHEAAHPHKKYFICECGAHPYLEGQYETANGNVQEESVCCICNGHKYGAEEETPEGTRQKTCANCGITTVTHVHDYELIQTTKLVDPDETKHYAETTSERKCKTCGHTIPGIVVTIEVPHSPKNPNNYTYRPGHPHIRYAVCECGTEFDMQGEYNTANGKVQEPNVCCICYGHKYGEAEVAADGTWKKTCANCGLSQKVAAPVIENCQHGKGYKNNRDIEKSPVYRNVNDLYIHMVDRKSYKEAECIVCGETLQLSVCSSTQPEAHKFNSDDICSLCGYVSLAGTYDVLDRFDAYASSNYYSNDQSMIYVGVGSPVNIMLYDKFAGELVRADGPDITLTLNDPNGIASIQNNVVVANSCGSFSVTVSYLGQTIETINIGVTDLSVNANFFEYQMESSGVVRLEDLDDIDWDDDNVLLTTSVSMGEYSSKKNNDGSQTVTFNAYNPSAVVVGIAVFDANGKQIDTTKLVESQWETGSFIEGAYKSFSSLSRVLDKNALNGTENQVTEISLKVPAGGHIEVLQMNEDPTVYAANIAEMFLGSIKICNDAESLVNPGNLKEVQSLIESLGKDEYYEIIRNYLIRSINGTNIDDLAFYIAEEAGDAMDAESLLEAIASQSDGIFTEIFSNVPEAVASSFLDKGEDAVLAAFTPYLYYIKHGGQSVHDTIGMHELMDSYNECMVNGTNSKIVSHIYVPQNKSNTPPVEPGKILTLSHRSVVTLDNCNLREVAGQEFQHFITIPSNTEIELLGSITGDDGETYYKVIYNGISGYIPANEAKV